MVQVTADEQPATAVQSAQTVSLVPPQALLANLPAGHVVHAWQVPPAK